MLDGAARLEDLKSAPGNRLEKLRGDRLGQHSIRINDQYRICFVWRGHDAYEVTTITKSADIRCDGRKVHK